MNRVLFVCIFLIFLGGKWGVAQEKKLFIKYDMVDLSKQFKVRMELTQVGLKAVSTTIKTVPAPRGATGGGAVVGCFAGGGSTGAALSSGSNGSGANSIRESFEYCEHMYKDYQTGRIIYKDMRTLVSEKMNLFNWQLISSTDTILGYKCQRAKTSFRGRSYTAWFCTDLPFKAAPWKFHGLPGVVLKVKSDDNYFILEASHLKISDTEESIENPFNGKKTITWDEFTADFKKAIIEGEKSAKASFAKMNRPFNPGCLLNPRVEIIVEKINNVTMKEMLQHFQ